MTDAVKIALIVGLFGIASLVIQGIIAAKATRVAKETKEAVDTVVHSVDGHLQAALDKMIKAIEANADARGQLAGRDFTRSHMEDRQDAIDKEKP